MKRVARARRQGFEHQRLFSGLRGCYDQGWCEYRDVRSTLSGWDWKKPTECTELGVIQIASSVIGKTWERSSSCMEAHGLTDIYSKYTGWQNYLQVCRREG